MNFFNQTNDNNLADLFSTLELDENIVYLFINVNHLWKDINKLKESGVMFYSLLLFDKNKLVMNSKAYRDYYIKNKENGNILFEDEKKYQKFKVKFIYLKFTNIDPGLLVWEQSVYVLDKKRHQESLFYNENINNSKLEICEEKTVKFKIGCSAILKNIIGNVVNIYKMKQQFGI